MTGADAAMAGPALCRFFAPGAGARLGGLYDGGVVDLTAREPEACASLAALLAGPTSLADVLARHAGAAPDYQYAELDRAPAPDAPHLLPPIDGQEVWAAGVTYTRSREARMDESEISADVYARVYDAERPELFFKAMASRVVGPNDRVAVRPDAAWSVPEAELTLVLDTSLRIAGYTIGDDLTARDVEAQNPLYLPQAKVYGRCCALGPVIVPAPSLDPYALDITCRIERGGRELFTGSANTGQLHRRLEDLVAYLGRCDAFPAGAFLMTGTGIVPPDDVSLGAGDVVEIAIGGLGTLRNTVTVSPRALEP
jgi:2-dehydro-3-deoxy-D-arabinonate dehydratase